MVTESHITEILDTPETVESVQLGETGETQGGPHTQMGPLTSRGRGEEGEAPWVRGHSQQVNMLRSHISRIGNQDVRGS